MSKEFGKGAEPPKDKTIYDNQLPPELHNRAVVEMSNTVLLNGGAPVKAVDSVFHSLATDKQGLFYPAPIIEDDRQVGRKVEIHVPGFSPSVTTEINIFTLNESYNTADPCDIFSSDSDERPIAQTFLSLHGDRPNRSVNVRVVATTKRRLRYSLWDDPIYNRLTGQIYTDFSETPDFQHEIDEWGIPWQLLETEEEFRTGKTRTWGFLNVAQTEKFLSTLHTASRKPQLPPR